ncbi:condensation domain-containing protein [Longispora urticae]
MHEESVSARGGPLSHAQERLFLSHQFDPDLDDNTVISVSLLTGALRPDVLASAVADVVDRHAVLRTIYTFDDAMAPVQVELSAAGAGVVTELSTFDGVTPPEGVQAVAEALCADWWDAPFDLENGPPARVRLVDLGADRHLLCIAVHHISIDGWSSALILNDLGIAYRARLTRTAPEWEPVPSYQDYIAWERDQLDRWVERDVPFWREALSVQPERLLPATSALSQVESVEYSTVVPADVVRDAVAYGRRAGALSLPLLLYGTAAVLGARFGQSRLCLGTVVSGRFDAEFHPVVGCFVNQLPVPVDIVPGADRLTELKRTARSVLDCLRHSRTPTDEVSRILGWSQRQRPWFQVVVVLHEFPGLVDFGSGVTLTTVQLRTPRIQSDLIIEAIPQADHSWLLRARWRRDGVNEEAGRGIVRDLAGWFTDLAA